MNGIMMCSSLGAMALAAVAAMSGPPESAETPRETTITGKFFFARQVDTAEPPKGRWEANLAPIGTLNIVVDEHGRRVLLNNQPLPSDRVIWQPHNLLMVIDESRQRQFEVALGENGRIDYIRPGTWLEYRGAGAPRVAIGIYTDPVPAPLASQLGLDPDTALLVKGVVENMPAFKSGVHQFDIITALDDQDQVTQETLQNIVFSKEPGQSIQLHLIRRSQPMEITVHVQEVQPLAQADLDPLITGPFKDFVIDPNSFTSPDDPWQFVPGGQRIIQFKNEQAIVFGSDVPSNINANGRPNQLFNITTRTTGQPDDMRRLEARIDVLSQRIASLEAMIAQLVRGPAATAPAGAQP